MTTKTLTLDFYQDPGHGWVKCKVALLQRLGIEQHISTYSYRRGDNVYLEEDCDLSVLYKACDNQGITLKLRDHIANKSSKIRSYDTYKHPAQRTNTTNFMAEHFKLLEAL